jgi:hypothetical protein
MIWEEHVERMVKTNANNFWWGAEDLRIHWTITLHWIEGGVERVQVAPLFPATTHSDVTADNNYKNTSDTNLSKHCNSKFNTHQTVSKILFDQIWDQRVGIKMKIHCFILLPHVC